MTTNQPMNWRPGWRGRGEAASKLALVVLVAALSGCVEKNRSDLEQFVAETLQRPSGRITPLPEYKPYENYTYKSGQLGTKSPFETFAEERGAPQEEETADECIGGVNPKTGQPCIQPNFDRNKEELEQFALDSLRMVGTIETQEGIYALILSREGTLHRVTTDNYMGQNHGRIINVREEFIELVEIIPNGLGGWEERPTKIALVE